MMFKYFFLWRKIKILNKIRERHLLEAEAWIRVRDRDSQSEWGNGYCYNMFTYHTKEARKIESQIKLLT